MSLEYSKQVFSGLEIELHDARRQIEHILTHLKYGSLPKDQEILKVHSNMVKMLSDITEYYSHHLNNFEKIEQIEIKAPDTNIIQFPGKDK